MKSSKEGVVRVAIFLAALVFMSCSSNKAKLIAISVTPADPVSAYGTVTQYQFTASGIFSDGKVLNFTSEVTWSSSNPDVATIGTTAGAAGLVTVLAAGTTTITAHEPYNNLSSSSVLHIGQLTAITVTPADVLMATGERHQFNATATYLLSDMTTTATQSLMLSSHLTWTSSDPSIALVSKGLVTAGTSTGTITITAKSKDGAVGDVSGTTTIKVTDSVLKEIAITPIDPTIVTSVTPTLPFTATGTFKDDTKDDVTPFVNWSSSDTIIITISTITGSRGLATAITSTSGTAVIKATDPITKVTGTMSVTVAP